MDNKIDNFSRSVIHSPKSLLRILSRRIKQAYFLSLLIRYRGCVIFLAAYFPHIAAIFPISILGIVFSGAFKKMFRIAARRRVTMMEYILRRPSAMRQEPSENMSADKLSFPLSLTIATWLFSACPQPTFAGLVNSLPKALRTSVTFLCASGQSSAGFLAGFTLCRMTVNKSLVFVKLCDCLGNLAFRASLHDDATPFVAPRRYAAAW